MVITFIGVLISLITQGFKINQKKKGEDSRFRTTAFLVLLALVGAGLFQIISALGYWEIVWGVLVTAGAFYAFIIKNVESAIDEA